MKKYLLIYLKETDGEIQIESLTLNQIQKKVVNMDSSDYAIIDGEILKSFKTK